MDMRMADKIGHQNRELKALHRKVRDMRAALQTIKRQAQTDQLHPCVVETIRDRVLKPDERYYQSAGKWV